jgi:3-isopropylmalate dehydratase small subunit
MEPFTQLEATAAALPIDNVDTDAIIPSRETQSVVRTGYGKKLFANWRYVPGSDYQPNTDFVLNRAPYDKAQILVSGRNFGCGSSREAAVWSLWQFGIKCVIAESFGTIFRNNCIRNGLLPISLPNAAVEEITAELAAHSEGAKLAVDLEKCLVRSPAGREYGFTIGDFDREMLLSGADEIGMTLKHRDLIEAFRAKDTLLRPWVYEFGVSTTARSDLMPFQEILFEQGADHVATITINRPARMNTFTDLMCDEFAEAWRIVRETDSIHAVVLRAAPECRAFSTGVDVSQGLEMLSHQNVWRQKDPGELLGPKHNDVWKPVVCAVHGLAAGGAFYWFNEADILICSEDAQFFDPHVTFGMVSALEPVGLARRIQLGEVLRFALLGNDERIGAATALRIGLVSEVTAKDALHARAHALAAIIAAKPTAATQGTVRAIWESLDMGRTTALKNAVRYWQVGNPLGQADIDRANMPKTEWKLR